MAGDKIRQKIEEGVGKAKEAVGRASDKERTTAEGRGEQDQAKMKKTGDRIREAARDATETFRR